MLQTYGNETGASAVSRGRVPPQAERRVGLGTSEFIPIYSPRGLRGTEAPALAGGPCPGLQSCPPACLALIRATGDALQRLVASCEAALHAQRACGYALHHVRMHLTLWPLIV
jgi:hypothetical protein